MLIIAYKGETTMKKLLSVCIPTYNRVNFLKESLITLLPQAERLSVEVCVSDNASSDQTGCLLKELSSQYKCLRYITQQINIGLDRNTIAAMEMADTEYILPIGDDEVIVEESLLTIVNELQENSLDLVVLNGYYTSLDLKNRVKEHLPTRLHNIKFYNPIEAFIELWYIMPLGSFVVKSQSLLLGNHQNYVGTNHSYTGVVWEYLAHKFSILHLKNIK
jgi:glycosyltransferase involved in cell wall biosynthesis